MTDYQAWDDILEELNDLSNFFSLELHFPYMVGCGLAGGNWDTMLNKIKDKFESTNTKVFIHKL
jgi:Na+/citrate or Na+/malate symporter